MIAVIGLAAQTHHLALAMQVPPDVELTRHPDPLGLRQGRNLGARGHPPEYGPESPLAMIGAAHCSCGNYGYHFRGRAVGLLQLY